MLISLRCLALDSMIKSLFGQPSDGMMCFVMLCAVGHVPSLGVRLHCRVAAFRARDGQATHSLISVALLNTGRHL